MKKHSRFLCPWFKQVAKNIKGWFRKNSFHICIYLFEVKFGKIFLWMISVAFLLHKKNGYQKPKTKPLHESQGFFFQFYDTKKLGIFGVQNQQNQFIHYLIFFRKPDCIGFTHLFFINYLINFWSERGHISNRYQSVWVPKTENGLFLDTKEQSAPKKITPSGILCKFPHPSPSPALQWQVDQIDSTSYNTKTSQIIGAL